jgi:hypothetical protein
MSQSDEQPVEEEDVVEATSEASEEGPDVEGHKWYREADKAAEPSKTFKVS